jgi:hypothetical protein
MTRTRYRLAASAAAAAALVLGACGGAGDATQSDVADQVSTQLIEDGYDGRTFDQDQADEAGDCVASTMFESDDFTKDERNEVARATNGDPPDQELVDKVQDLVDGCLAGLGSTGDA